jgi:glycosyltransferase involved in cell wall biosynthesis
MIAYNVERYVAQALESVLMQDCDFACDIVVGEDASTDGTRGIVEAYAARYPDRVRPIYHARNLGMNRNFVATLLAARGEYIALLDADDYWTAPHKLRMQVAFLDAHRDFSICFHNAQVVYEGQDIAPHPFHLREPIHLISHHVPKPVSTIADLAGGNFMQTCSVMFRAGLHGPLPDWYLEMPTFDWPLHLLNAAHGPIGYLDEVMGVYRVHPGSFWSTDMVFYRKLSDVDGMIHGYDLVNRFTNGEYDETIRGQVLPLYERAATLLTADGRHARAAAYAWRAWRAAGRPHQGARRRALKTFARSLGRMVMP